MLQKIGYMEEDNIIEKKPWRGIPPEYTDRWREIYNNAAPEEGMHLSDACPVCGDTELYRYYSLLKTQPTILVHSLTYVHRNDKTHTIPNNFQVLYT